MADFEAAYEALVERASERAVERVLRRMLPVLVTAVVEALQAADVSVDEAARIKNVEPVTIRRMAKAGKLAGAMRCGREWRIPRSALKGAVSDSEIAAVAREARA